MKELEGLLDPSGQLPWRGYMKEAQEEIDDFDKGLEHISQEVDKVLSTDGDEDYIEAYDGRLFKWATTSEYLGPWHDCPCPARDCLYEENVADPEDVFCTCGFLDREGVRREREKYKEELAACLSDELCACADVGGL